MVASSILEWFREKPVLITGGTGLIGRQVVKILCDHGARVAIVSLDKVHVDGRAEHIYGDLTNFEFCKEVVVGRDCVFHLAGVKGSIEVSKSMLASHFVPTLMVNTNVLEACMVHGVSRVVYTSSIGAYADSDVLTERDALDDFGGPPLDFAGWAKRMGELQVHAYKVQYGLEHFAIVRPANVYGPGDNFDPANAMVIPSLMARIRRGERPLRVWGDGGAVRDFAFSRDVAEGIILALYHGTGGGYINLGSGLGTSIRELVDTLASFLNFPFEFDATKPSGRPMKMMDISRARQLIGYNPATRLEEGLKETWEWYLEHEGEHRDKLNYFKP